MNAVILKLNENSIKVQYTGNIEYSINKINEQINDIFDEYIYFEKIKDQEDLLNIIVKYLDTSHIINTVNCYYTDQYQYQIIFIEGTNESKNINYLGTQIANGIIALNDVILIKNKIITDNKCELDCITKNDIKEIIFNKFISEGISVDTNDNITMFYYMRTPLEKYSYDECKEKYRFLEVKIFNSILDIYYTLDIKDKINRIATLICNKIVYGSVLFTLTIEEPQYNSIFNLNLNENYFNKLNKLLSLKNYAPLFDKYEGLNFINIYRCIDNEHYNIQKNDIKDINEIIKKNEIINNIK